MPRVRQHHTAQLDTNRQPQEVYEGCCCPGLRRARRLCDVLGSCKRRPARPDRHMSARHLCDDPANCGVGVLGLPRSREYRAAPDGCRHWRCVRELNCPLVAGIGAAVANGAALLVTRQAQGEWCLLSVAVKVGRVRRTGPHRPVPTRHWCQLNAITTRVDRYQPELLTDHALQPTPLHDDPERAAQTPHAQPEGEDYSSSPGCFIHLSAAHDRYAGASPKERS